MQGLFVRIMPPRAEERKNLFSDALRIYKMFIQDKCGKMRFGAFPHFYRIKRLISACKGLFYRLAWLPNNKFLL